MDKYNIPVPVEFRNHILKNYKQRMRRHLLLKLVDRVVIHNNTYMGRQYEITILKTGTIWYQNNMDCIDGAMLYVRPEDAEYIIDPIMSEIFYYDADDRGTATIDGYHWKLIFYIKHKMIDTIEGWPNEDLWRYREIKHIIEFAERFIPKDMGTRYMNECGK